jgi:2-dehydropantoate 2-reductase
VADHLQIRLKYKDPMQQIIQVINATALNYSSMYQDLQRGAPTEIDQINGAISRLGMTNGIQTPYNLCVTALVKSRVSINSSR